jgi:hypothetical protein
MKKHYFNFALIVTNTLLLFLVLNIIAYFIPSPLKIYHEEELISSPLELIKKNPTLLQKIHEGKEIDEISNLYKLAPNVKSHPTMEFMTIPTSNKFYHVGKESCRYNEFVNDNNFNQLINKSIWFFGGSTAFGNGVSDNETITYFLNQNDSTNTYFNFGTPSFHQKMEIEKLILLLQKGYRPSRVIFFDGLNDLYKISESNFNPFETANRSINSYAHDFNLGTIGKNKSLVYGLPVVKRFYEFYANHLLTNDTFSSENLGNIYNQNSIYNTQPILHYYINEVKLHQYKNTNETLIKLYHYYNENIQLLEALSKQYHFEYHIFFQPIGSFYNENPFIKDTIEYKNNFRFYKNVEPAYQKLMKFVNSKKIPKVVDLSKAHYSCSYPYVDLTHYSKQMNKKLAELILLNITKRK